MEPDRYALLRLEKQLCFPLYAASREVIRHYRPHLDALNLTYTQYITMMVLWAEQEISVKRLGRQLYLDSGTLTPLLKSLEAKGYVTRTRSESDERVVLVRLTDAGLALQEKALSVPAGIRSCIHLTPEESETLYKLLYKLLADEKGI
ncbi:MAG: MarR family transcriptional regulator [Oscillospiraceae bacterium]|nr:MarR family transcriptional regulator [Oscillospiraceae bacterium]